LEEVGYLPFPAELDSLVPEFSPVVVSNHRGADWVVQVLRGLERRAFVAWDLDTGSVIWLSEVDSPTAYNPLTAERVGEDTYILHALADVDRTSFPTLNVLGGDELWRAPPLLVPFSSSLAGLYPFGGAGVSFAADSRVLRDGTTGEQIASLDGCSYESPVGGTPYDPPSIFDLDGDGLPEILTSMGVFDIDGVPRHCFEYASQAAPAQLDSTENFEVVRLDQTIPALQGLDAEGASLWETPLDGFSGVAGRLSIGDADGDGMSDLFSHETSNREDVSVLRRHRHDGRLCWTRTVGDEGPYPFSSPLLHDFWGDGLPELLAAGRDEVGVFDASSGTTLGTYPLSIGGRARSFAVTGRPDGEVWLLAPRYSPGPPSMGGLVILSAGSPPAGGTSAGDWLGHSHTSDRGEVGSSWKRAALRATDFDSVARESAPDLAVAGVEVCDEEVDSTGESVVFVAITNLGDVEGAPRTVEFFPGNVVPDSASVDHFGTPVPDLLAPALFQSTGNNRSIDVDATEVLELRVPQVQVDPEGWLAVGTQAGRHQDVDCDYTNNWMILSARDR